MDKRIGKNVQKIFLQKKLILNNNFNNCNFFSEQHVLTRLT